MDAIDKMCIEMTKSLKKDDSVMNLAKMCVAVFECPALPNAIIPNVATYIFAKELLETHPCKQESASTQADSVAPDNCDARKRKSLEGMSSLGSESTLGGA